MKFKKLLSLLTISTLLISTTNLQHVNANVDIGFDVSNANEINIPAFPEDIDTAPTDWSETDWDSETILPADKFAYEKKLEELLNAGDFEAVKNLEMKKTSLSDDASLEIYDVPKEVQEVVKDHYENSGGISVQGVGKPLTLKEKLQKLPSPYKGKELDVRSEDLTIEKELPEISKNKLKTVKKKSLQAISLGKANIGNLQLEEQVEKDRSISLQGVNTPLIEYYDGISNNNVDYALYSLTSLQSENGLIGNSSRNTYEFLQLLKSFKKTDNSAYYKAKNYFLNLVPRNNLELVYKIQVMKDEGQDYSSLVTSLKNSMNSDKGYPLLEGYDSDIYTSIETLNLLTDLNDSAYIDPMNYILGNIGSTGEIKYYLDGGKNSSLLSYKVLQTLEKLTFADKDTYITKIRDNLAINSERSTLESSLYGLLLEKDGNVLDEVQFMKNDLKKLQSYDGSFTDDLTTIYTSLFLAEADLVIESVTPVGTLKHKDAAKLTVTIKNNGYKKSLPVGIHTYTNKYYHAGKATAISDSIDSNSTVIFELDFSSTPRFKGDVEFDFFLDNQGDINYEDNWFNSAFNFVNTSDNSPVLPMNYSAFSHESSAGLGIAAIWNDTGDIDLQEYVVLVRNKGESDWKEIVLNKTLYPEGAFISGFNEGDKVEVTMGVRLADSTLSYFSNFSEFTITPTANKLTSNVNGKLYSNKLGVYNELLKGNGYSTTSEPGGDFDISVPAGKTIISIDKGSGYESFENSITADGVTDITGYEYHTRLKVDAEKPVMSDLKFNDNFAIKNRKTKNIIISGTDNIGIREFHLYYYDPEYASWIFENSMTPDYGQSTYTWSIPETLLGTGYKLKTVAIDYKGNESLPLEYGPFEIIDGTAPEGTIEITGLEAGSKWKLGDTKEFTWNVDLVYDLQQIVNVKLHYENAFTYIANSIDVIKTSESYTIPIDSKYLANVGYISLLACDVQNNCSTLESPRFEIYEEEFQSKGPWNQPSDIGISLSNGNYNRYIEKVFFGENETIEVIFSEFDKYTGRDYRLVYRKYENGVWGDEQVVKQYNNPSSGPSHSFNSIKSVKLGNKIGITYSDFYKDLTASGFGYDESEIYAITIENSILGNLTQISNDTTLSYNPELEFDDNGLYVIWKEGYSITTETGNRKLKLRKADINGIWNNEIILSEDSVSYYDLEYQNNRLFISYVFEDNLKLKEYNYSTSTWNNEILIGAETGIKENKIFHRNGTEIYDLFLKKITPNTTGLEKYHLIHKKVDLTGGTANILLEKNITAASDLESLQKYTIENKDGTTYHLVYTKLSLTENGDKISINYSEYGDNLNTNYLVLSPATNIISGSNYLFTSKLNDVLKLGYVSTIGGVTKLQYVTGDFTPKSSEFSFPEFDIDVTMNLNEFRVTFIFLGYRFSFWLNLL
ncbi:hypothetical protein A9Q91_03525 [Candidatus Gracilibacteria bacterium 28_42_T64]|nr:hypothetical protein A9Q91_03525 [Candidatus Gracilibacteria bacterium 28_42_T64]